MKIIKYKILAYKEYDDAGSLLDDCFNNVSMGWSEANEEIAKAEAYNGEYTIEDDGQPDLEKEVTTDEIIDVLLGVLK